MANFKYTTEHLNDTDVLVRVYKGKKIIHKFLVQDFGDWNEVEDTIERTINTL